MISRRNVIGGTLALAALADARRIHAQQPQSLKIGFVTTLSGSLGDIGNYSLLGSRMAVKEVNESGGVNGQQVELVIRDARFNPADAIAAMHELVGNGVNLILGEGFSNMVAGAIPVLDSLDAIYISPAGIFMEGTHDKFNRHYFRCGANAHMQYGGQAIVMAKVAPNAVRWGGIVSDFLGARSGWESFTLSLKRTYPKYANKQVEIVEPVLVKPGTTDFRDAIAKLAAQNLDGMQTGVFGGEAISFYQQGRPFGLFQKLKAIADTVLNVHAGPALHNAVPPNFWSYYVWDYEGYKQVPMAQRFYKDIMAESKQTDVDAFSSHAHTAVMSFVSGVRNAKSTKTDAVIAAMETMTFDSIFGPMRYRKEDHQLLVNPGYLHVEPQEAPPGYHNTNYIITPYTDVIEPPTPGVAFKEG